MAKFKCFVGDNGQIAWYDENDLALWNRFKKFHKGAKLQIEEIVPESIKQRAFFEGAVIPLITYFQEGMSHRDSHDIKKVHNWIRDEFCPETFLLGKTLVTQGSTTYGKLEKEKVVERVMDWIADNYGVDPYILLNSEEYKHWRDVIFPHDFGGPDNYIDYLVKIHKLRPCTSKNK